MRKALDRVQDRLPFRHGLARHERLEAGDQRGQFRSGGRGPALAAVSGRRLARWPARG